MAKLSEEGFYGFLEEGENELRAYINSGQLSMPVIEEFRQEYSFSFSIREIIEENWNALWEASFDPVIVDKYVAIRADFHDIVKDVDHEIIITPKMSFGTGHHATTFLMIQEMQKFNFTGRSVLDFGTGTGVLAILAAKSGAAKVLAIDNDPWSIENARENAVHNDCRNIQLSLSSKIPDTGGFDIILANINKHILLQYSGTLCESLRPSGILIMSGILAEDRDELEKAYSQLGKPLIVNEKNNWLLITFRK